MIEVIEKKLRFLLVEDNREDTLIIRNMIDQTQGDSRIELDVAVNFNEFFKQIDLFEYDLFLLDYRLEEDSGLELLKTLRKKNTDVPVIILTGQGDQDTVVEALRLGATDYMDKNNLNAETLDHSLQRGLRLHQESLQKKKMQARLSLQKKLFSSLSEAVSCLLKTSNHDTGIGQAIEIMAQACSADGVALIEYHLEQPAKTKKWVVSSSWTSSPDEVVISKVKDILNQLESYPKIHKCLKGFEVGTKLEPVSKIDSFGFTHTLLVPIQVHNRFWGFLTFGKMDSQIQINDCLISTLQTFSASLGWNLKRNHEERALQELVQQTSGETGDEFFEALVENIAIALEVRCAYVSEIVERGLPWAKPIKGWNGSEVVTGDKFNLKNTPAEEILCGMYSYYPEGVKNLFPQFICLQEFNIEGYAAVPFYDTAGKILGHLSIMSEHPLNDSERVLSILRLFGARAATEIERQKAENKIRDMAFYDALTGLPNRLLLSDRMEVALRQARRNKNKVAIIYLDFDHFKNINDTYGHLSGDLLLKEGARRLENCLRRGDTVSRQGGDEFVIILPEIKTKSDIARLALKINGSVKAPFFLEDTEIKTSVSLGISVFPQDGDTTKTLLQKADQALFISKNSGRDSFNFAVSPPANGESN